jgi:hypothetical protein
MEKNITPEQRKHIFMLAAHYWPQGEAISVEKVEGFVTDLLFFAGFEMKKKIIYAVFHTTDQGADYKVSPGFKDRGDAVDWEHQHREKYVHPLIIRKIVY